MKSIGSDVPLGLDIQNLVLTKNGKLCKFKKKLNFHTLVVKPHFGCSTKTIYSKSRIRNKSLYTKPGTSLFSKENIIKSKNDLEGAAFKLYPKLKEIKLFLCSLPRVIFARMTGSGSCVVAYYATKKDAAKGLKLFKKKYKNYWCIVSKLYKFFFVIYEFNFGRSNGKAAVFGTAIPSPNPSAPAKYDRDFK